MSPNHNFEPSRTDLLVRLNRILQQRFGCSAYCILGDEEVPDVHADSLRMTVESRSGERLGEVVLNNGKTLNAADRELVTALVDGLLLEHIRLTHELGDLDRSEAQDLRSHASNVLAFRRSQGPAHPNFNYSSSPSPTPQLHRPVVICGHDFDLSHAIAVELHNGLHHQALIPFATIAHCSWEQLDVLLAGQGLTIFIDNLLELTPADYLRLCELLRSAGGPARVQVVASLGSTQASDLDRGWAEQFLPIMVHLPKGLSHGQEIRDLVQFVLQSHSQHAPCLS